MSRVITMKDYLAKAYAFDGTVRLYAADTTKLVYEAQKTHDLWPTSAVALGRFLTGSIIMGAMYQHDHELTVRIDADGPLEGMVATTNAKGEVRGYVGNPHVFMQHSSGNLPVSQAVGQGKLHVTKDLKVRDIFTGSVELQTGEIATDFAYYFSASEQIPSAVALGVRIDEDNSVLNAGGFILQRMPGCKEETVNRIEKRLESLPPMTELLEEGYKPEDIIARIAGKDHELLHTMPLRYHCDCDREKFERGLISLGDEQLRDLLEKDKGIETVCHFCKTKYHFGENDVQRLIDTAQKK